jgi:hypothetical protein
VQEIWTDTKRFWIFFNSHWNIKKETRRKMFIWDCSIMLQVTVSAHFNGCYFTGLKNTFLGTSRDCDFNETICPAHNIRFSMMKIEGSNAEERTK